MKIEKVAIVGMGALGMMYGAKIVQSCGLDAVTYYMDEVRLAHHAQDIYTVNGEKIPFRIKGFAEAEAADLVIIATKFNGLEDALRNMDRLIGPHTAIFSVLNGITSEELIKKYYGDENLLYCVVLGMDAVREGMALTFTHEGKIQLGYVDDKQKTALSAVCEFLQRAKLNYELPDDIMHALWAKLMLNVGINQTCMVYETSYGGAFANETAHAEMAAAMHEVIAIAQKVGVNLTERDYEAACSVLQGLTYEGIPSMRQDALAKRYSEVELFAGTICRMGAELGIAVPVNEKYYRKIREIEAAY